MNYQLALCLALAVSAQTTARSQDASVGVRRVPGPVRHAAYSVQTAGWVEAAQTQAIGADVIYNNSCSSGFYWALDPGTQFVDDGILPGPTNPGWAPYYSPGCQTSYRVSGLEIEYCSPLPWVDAEVLVFDQRYHCASTTGLVTRATLLFPGLPGSSDGSVQCWRVIIDLDGVGPGAPFDLPADGDGVFDGPWPGSQDRFGVTFRATNATGTTTGPSLAGEGTCTFGAGTRWAPTIDYAQPGTGTGNTSFVLLDGLGGFSCHLSHFGAGMHLRLFADACVPPPGIAYCFGDGRGSPCPCGSSSPVGAEEGCPNSLNGTNGAGLTAVGTASLTTDNVVMTVSGLPGSGASLLYQGTLRALGGAGVAFGDGLRCAVGSVLRLGVAPTNTLGQVSWPLPGDPALSVLGAITGPSTRTYQVWYRNAVPFCTSASFNLSNGVEVAWAN